MRQHEDELLPKIAETMHANPEYYDLAWVGVALHRTLVENA